MFFEGLVSLSDEHDDQGGEPLRADFERREPRCRICRHETVRILVNQLWSGAVSQVILGRTYWSPSTGGRTRPVRRVWSMTPQGAEGFSGSRRASGRLGGRDAVGDQAEQAAV